MPAAPQHYRPELDGLRAIAVVAVLLFHLDAAWLPGGFAGVDVFFVLSGYLVTSILLRDHYAGRLQLRTFYQRRIARIFPAFLAMALVTLLAARFCYSSWDYASAGAAFSAALLSIANFHLLGQGNYFQLSADAQPLLHTWSLSVEEQFYLIFPFLFALLLKAPPRRRLLLTWLVVLLSFATCLFLTATRPIHAFYLLPSRAWEMLAGSLLALHAAPRPPARGSPSHLPALGGLAAILASFLLLQEGPRFPGWQALLPVLGTAAVIRYSQSGPVHRVLSWKPFVLTGRLSYSLYLWHWPVCSFIDYSLLYQSPTTRLLLKLLLTLLTATACHHFIEQPARAWLNQPRHRWSPFLLLGTALALLAPLGYSIHRRHYLDASNGHQGALVIPTSQSRGSLVLMGDSQGSMYGQLARDLATQRGLKLIILSTAGADPLATREGSSPVLFERTLDTIRHEKPAIVLLACHWIYKLQQDPDRLALTIQAIQPHAGRIIIFTQPPLLPPAATRSAIRQGSRPPFFESPADRTLRLRLNQTVKALASPGISIIDTDPFFTQPDGSLILQSPTGQSFFHDPVHLSTHGANQLKQALLLTLPPPPLSSPP